MEVSQQLAQIKERIQKACMRVGRDASEVKIVAVTKYVTNARAKEAVEAGLTHIGENRIEGLKEKQAFLPDANVSWHFIGSLQSRKVKDVLQAGVDYIHSLDRISLAEEIQKRSTSVVKCLIQVNISEEESKHGLKVEALNGFVKQLAAFDRICVVGLMTMAPLEATPSEIRAIFCKLKQLQTEIQALNLSYAPCYECSMGMSNDFEIAIEEGATFIRLGTVLVG